MHPICGQIFRSGRAKNSELAGNPWKNKETEAVAKHRVRSLPSSEDNRESVWVGFDGGGSFGGGGEWRADFRGQRMAAAETEEGGRFRELVLWEQKGKSEESNGNRGRRRKQWNKGFEGER